MLLTTILWYGVDFREKRAWYTVRTCIKVSRYTAYCPTSQLDYALLAGFILNTLSNKPENKPLGLFK